jgi:microcin C transport system permease protein
MWKPKLNPITRKRLNRFVSIRRSYWSFWSLLGLYVCSLIAELLCNDRPLFVRYDGETYFPVFFYYPEDTFTGSGLQTRPNYKAIASGADFADTDGHYMIFPVIPYGPLETLNANQIENDDTVLVNVARTQLIGSINVDANWTISRSQGAAPLFKASEERELKGAKFSEFAPISQGLEEAVLSRLTNERASEEYEEETVFGSGLSVTASLSAYAPRSRAPTSVRITLREVVDASSAIVLAFHGSEEIDDSMVWGPIEEPMRSKIREKALERLTGRVGELDFKLDGIAYTAAFEKEDVHFPFRPTGNHWFGLDSSGRDVLARILYGLRISLNFGLALVFSTMILGVVLGGLQGYHGGKVDLAGQRVTEIWEALPFLYIMIFMGSVFGRSFALLLLIYGAFNWIGISYYMRGEFLKLRKQPFVEAARCLGLSDWKIMSKHILPNALVPVITFFPFSLVGAIFSLSALDFLGFGMPPPIPSWGELLSQAQEFKYAWWLVLYPSLALFVVILLGVFIGEGVRAAFDPRVNSRYES